jgi:photosystem II stability/assembly factor-like uncharacterized protein
MRPAHLAFVVVTTWTGLASANGRFPYANHLVVDPADHAHVVVRSTYGILQSFDAGASWKWLCEQSVGYGGPFDPAITVSGSGRGLVGLFDGLTTTVDRGCTWVAANDPVITKQFVIDFVLDAQQPTRVLALTSTGTSDGFHVVVAESNDGGGSFAPLGVDLPRDFDSETLEIAASRPERIYLSGTAGEPRQGVIEKTDDAGKTWERLAFDLQGGLAPYLAAIDPKDPDVVYARLDGNATDGQGDSLWVTRDGAKSWTQIGQTKGEMLGFALSPDGSKIAFGGPTDGLWLTSTATPAPAPPAPVKVSGVGVRCLTWSAAGLYACGSEYPDGFTVGLSKDEGRTFDALNHLSALAPLECPSTTPTGALCGAEWPKVQATIGTDDDAGLPADAGPSASPPASSGEGGCSYGALAKSPWALTLVMLAALAGFSRRRPR